MVIIANYHFTIDTNHDYIEGVQPKENIFLENYWVGIQFVLHIIGFKWFTFT